MNNPQLHIRQFEPRDEAPVAVLWDQALPSSKPWNEPKAIIERKLSTQPDLFFVGQSDGQIVATVMAGFDGVRGWIYSLAVSPEYRGRGFGRRIMEHAERSLRKKGCPKVNLQIRSPNETAVAFYQRLGFEVEGRISMGKPLADTETSSITDPVPTLNVDGVICLSQITWADKSSLLKYLNETDIFHRHTETIPYPYTVSDAERWLTKVCCQTLEHDQCRGWAIRTEHGELIGTSGLTDLTPGEKAEIGYWLAQPYWGRGITTHVVRTLCEFSFAQYNLQRIYARVLEINPGSARVLEKAGFVLEGRLPKHMFRDGEAFDVRYYGLLRTT